MNYLNNAVKQIDSRIAQLKTVREVLVGLDGYVATRPWARKKWASAGEEVPKGKRRSKMSAAGREAIRKAQKARWAKVHAAQAKGKRG